MQFKIGEQVRVRVFGGEIVTRRVVGENRRWQVVHLCNEETYQEAVKNDDVDNCSCIGFPWVDIVEKVDTIRVSNGSEVQG